MKAKEELPRSLELTKTNISITSPLQDHRFIKRLTKPGMGFTRSIHARAFDKGIRGLRTCSYWTSCGVEKEMFLIQNTRSNFPLAAA